MKGEIVSKILDFPFNIRQRKISQIREYIDEEKFIQDIVSNGGDRYVAKEIYLHLRNWICDNEFSSDIHDNLEIIYGIADEELDDEFIFKILNILNIHIPSYDFTNSFGKINTPLDVARFITLAKNETFE